jgi:prolyl-tRNA editing enzyme YbaK/EbsC (Cys-tRNA(Pro) deacylase)
MSLESVRAFLAENAPDIPIIELATSSDTVSLSAAWHIKPAQIAKTLSLRVGDRNLLLVTCGDSRLDNRKVKAVLGGKAKMLPPADAAAITGHPVGGVCPFGLGTPLPIYCDVLLKQYDVVVPGAGSTHAALRIHPLRLAELVGAQWVDVCEHAQQA